MTVGSMNEDARGMMLDGEVADVVSGEWSLRCSLDVFFLLGTTTWLESQRRAQPRYPGSQARPSAMIRSRSGP
jgi:hypothetical protein